jgi:hypothetical protein
MLAANQQQLRADITEEEQVMAQEKAAVAERMFVRPEIH